MTRAPVARSLANGLSRRLALQTLFGLAFVCALVFLAIVHHLRAAQASRLAEMRTLVEHLVEEKPSTGDPEVLTHLLEDVFAGHAEMGLELRDMTGHALMTRRLFPDRERLPTEPTASVAAVRTSDFPLSVPGSSPLSARLSLATGQDEALLHQLGWALAAAVLLGTLINSVAAAWRVRRDLAPLSGLTRQIDAVDAGTLDRRLEGAGQPAELQPLVERFNGLLDRLDRSYRQMASFNSDVAHELNTPLATLTTSNEVALSANSDLAAMTDLLGSNLEELDRLGGIVRDMLFLSTAERGAQARTSHVESLADEVRIVLDYHDAALEEAGLDIEITGDASASVDGRLLRRALSNLVGNATRHAESGSTVDIHVGPASDEPDCIGITVTNLGDTVPAEDVPRLFDRFFRSSAPSGDPASGAARGDATRHGLGLSIVAAIASMHGGRTTACSRDGLTSIGLVMPRVPDPVEADRQEDEEPDGARSTGASLSVARYLRRRLGGPAERTRSTPNGESSP